MVCWPVFRWRVKTRSVCVHTQPQHLLTCFRWRVKTGVCVYIHNPNICWPVSGGVSRQECVCTYTAPTSVDLFQVACQDRSVCVHTQPQHLLTCFRWRVKTGVCVYIHNPNICWPVAGGVSRQECVCTYTTRTSVDLFQVACQDRSVCVHTQPQHLLTCFRWRVKTGVCVYIHNPNICWPVSGGVSRPGVCVYIHNPNICWPVSGGVSRQECVCTYTTPTSVDLFQVACQDRSVCVHTQPQHLLTCFRWRVKTRSVCVHTQPQHLLTCFRWRVKTRRKMKTSSRRSTMGCWLSQRATFCPSWPDWWGAPPSLPSLPPSSQTCSNDWLVSALTSLTGVVSFFASVFCVLHNVTFWQCSHIMLLWTDIQ